MEHLIEGQIAAAATAAAATRMQRTSAHRVQPHELSVIVLSTTKHDRHRSTMQELLSNMQLERNCT
eukprot:1620019-Pleurochrysis_carterae.AAC.2